MMFAKTAFPATTSASSGESLTGRSGPQPAPSTSTGGPAATSAAPPSPPTLGGGGPTSHDGRRVSRGGCIGSHSGGPFCKACCRGGCATEGVAAAEVTEAPNTIPQPTQKGALEVVYGRRALPSRVKIPLPCLMVKAQQAIEEMEEGFRQEWEELEAEHLRLSNWERRPGPHPGGGLPRR
jgi:hypothetical protein